MRVFFFCFFEIRMLRLPNGENTAKRLFSDFNLGTRKNIDAAKFE